MRLTRLAKLAIVMSMVAAVVPATVTGSATAAPPTVSGSRPDNPGLTEKAAARALDAIEAAFGRDPGGQSRPTARGRGTEITQQLLQLRLGFGQLSSADQRTAAAYLARPTDGSEFYGANYGRRARATNDCVRRPTAGSNVCVHWARRTADAPPARDSDGDTLPNQVERTRDTMNLVWSRIVDAGLYKEPLPDQKGPDEKLDVYLVDIGGDGLYGYCGSERVGQGRSHTAYCVLDDDYANRQYPSNTPLGNLRVTAVHEFFHAVQFAYDAREDAWLMESTSTWIEDEIFDDVNDNLYYLSRSSLAAPHKPLDSSGGLYLYGNWIWWRYLTERFPQESGTGLPVLVREIWERADDSGPGGTYSMMALSQELDERGRDLAKLYAEFSSHNRVLVDPVTGIYEEGETYRRAPLSTTHRLDGADRARVRRTSPSLAHMSSSTVSFVPDSGYDAGEWSLKVSVDLPNSSREPVAEVAVFGTDGSVERDFIALAGDGTGALQTDFSGATVRRVELTLTNGDHSYEDCNFGTAWSCQGFPDVSRPFTYWASTTQLAP